MNNILRKALNMLGKKSQLDRAGLIQVVGPRNVMECDWSHVTEKQQLLQRRELSHMGFHCFRPFQREIVTAVMDDAKVDIIVQMPTNAGKTTLFALPALVEQCGKCAVNSDDNDCNCSKLSPDDVANSAYTTCRSFTLVLSPLRALIADQVERLRSHYHVPTINLETASNIEMESMLVPMPDARKSDGEHIVVPTKLALLTPEKLTKNEWVQRALWTHHREGRVSRIVVDEMHYVTDCDQRFRQVLIISY